jgi:hypothetical protein
VRSFLDEQFGAGQCHAGGSAGDHRYLAIELSHDLCASIHEVFILILGLLSMSNSCVEFASAHSATY